MYLQIDTADGTYLKFLTSKTRVARLVEQTIPRLELLSALILARLISHIQSVLEEFIPISHVRCWFDSEVALFGFVEKTVSGGENCENSLFRTEYVRSEVLCH